MDHHSSDNDDYDDLPPSHPARRREFGSKHERTHKSRGGWGEAMELAHQKSSSNSVAASVVAVDLNQFRNTEVGTGYQARHVVRQKTAANANLVHNKTGNLPTTQKGAHQQSKSGQTKAIATEELLKNDGLRAFRKEIESILSS